MPTPYATQEHLFDLFTGNAAVQLAAHTPDAGGPWSNVSTYVPILDGAGGVYQPLAVGTLSPAALTPTVPTANYFVQAQIKLLTAIGDATLAAIVARCTADLTYYALQWEADDVSALLFKRIAGAVTVLGTYPLAIAAGETHSLVLVLEGTTLTAVIDSVPQAPVTDAAIAAAGKAGIRTNPATVQAAGTGLHVRQFQCGYLP